MAEIAAGERMANRPVSMNQDPGLRLPGQTRVSEGDTLPLKAEAGMLHLFDPETGRRLADL